MNVIIEKIKVRTTKKIELFLKRLGIKVSYLPEFLSNPYNYLGCKDKLYLIIDICLRTIIGKYFSILQKQGFQIKDVYFLIFNQIYNKSKRLNNVPFRN